MIGPARGYLERMLLLVAMPVLAFAACASASGSGPVFGDSSVSVESINTIHDAVSVVALEQRDTLLLAACPTGVTQLGSANVFSTPLAGGAAKVLNTTELWGSPAGLVVAGDQVVVVVHPEPEGHQPGTVQPMTGIYRIPLVGGPATPLWEGAPLVKPNRIVLVDDTLYVADMNAGPNLTGAIFRLPVTGGKPETVWKGGPLEDPIGLTVGLGGLFIADRGTPASGDTNSDPGEPGMVLFLPLEAAAFPEIVARGGLLKNPLDLELVEKILFIADEGVDGSSLQGVYGVSLSGWSRGVDLTSSIKEVRSGNPFKEPIALTQAAGKLYVVDDTKSETYLIDLDEASTLFGGTTQSGTRAPAKP